MEYIQTTKALRHKNGITAHRILDIKGNSLFFQLWLNDTKKEELSISISEEYHIGQYVDLQVIRTGKTSYQIKLIGVTPKAFIPVNGVNVAV